MHQFRFRTQDDEDEAGKILRAYIGEFSEEDVYIYMPKAWAETVQNTPCPYNINRVCATEDWVVIQVQKNGHLEYQWAYQLETVPV